MNRRALVVGATGMVGTRLVEVLAESGFSVVGLCRTPPRPFGRLEYVAADLLDYETSKNVLSKLTDITHVFYTARANHGEGRVEPIEENATILRNVVELVDKYAPQLEHVHVVHGAKYYGCHLGPYKTPAREDDPRHIGPNFYYDQQDYLISKSGRWRWSISRPALVYDYAPQQSRNPVSLIAVYAELSRALGLPLEYPGDLLSYSLITEAASASHLARAIAWIATNTQCANQAFNVTNGDCFRWENLWPEIAAFFKLPVGIPRDLNLSQAMIGKDKLWMEMVQGQKLKPNSIESLARWSFGDFMFGQQRDLLMSTTKLAISGFTDVVDTRDMLFKYFEEYRASKIIP
jgi:nucleoside-diphosphate-sugar epimerase